ncbi:MAG: hotdog fold thioesterase [Bacteroidota bacterium]
MAEKEDLLKKIAEEAIPFHKFLGVEVLELKDGFCKIRIPLREEIIGDPRFKRWHGGVIATAMDSAGGMVAMMTLASGKEKVATIDLRIDYLRGTSPTDLVVNGYLVRSGNRVIAARMEAYQENEEKLVAEGRAMFSVYREEK